MEPLPVYTVDALTSERPFDSDTFTQEDAVALGLLAAEYIRTNGYNLAVRVGLHGDVVFLAKLGSTGPGNDSWLHGKAAVAERFGEASLLVRRRHEEAGTPFTSRTDVDHDLLRAHGGSLPITVRGALVGTITTSGEKDVIDHQVTRRIVDAYLDARRPLH